MKKYSLFFVTKPFSNRLTSESERKEVKRVGQESLEKRYKTYYMRVFSYAMTLTGNRAQAEEITQETFFRAFLAQDRFRGESDEATWLCAIAKNYYLNEKRRRSRLKPIPEDAPDSAKEIGKIAEDRESSFRIHLALHQLEEPFREVFTLRVFGELSFREIGVIFKKTENWARVTYHRARLKLRERLGEQ